MRTIDTSAWIEWLAEGPLGRKVQNLLPAREEWIVPTIVQLELSKWLVRERSEDAADRVIAYSQKCVVVPLDTALALLAAEMHRRYKLATADAIVYATAQMRDAELVTCDGHFQGLPDATVVH